MTVAMLLASKGIVPPKEWYHDPKLTNNNNKTVEYYLNRNNITVPDKWKVNG